MNMRILSLFTFILSASLTFATGELKIPFSAFISSSIAHKWFSAMKNMQIRGPNRPGKTILLNIFEIT